MMSVTAGTFLRNCRLVPRSARLAFAMHLALRALQQVDAKGCCDYDLKSKSRWPPGVREEKRVLESWYKNELHMWDEHFQKSFTIWDEFDLQPHQSMVDQIKSLPDDPDRSVSCVDFFQDMRYQNGYESIAPYDIYDWDDKIGKKAIVASLAPDNQAEEDLWYTPSIYEAYMPQMTQPKEIEKLMTALKTYFDAHPDGSVFFKSALAGGSGPSIQECKPGTLVPGPVFFIKRANVALAEKCMKLLSKDALGAKSAADRLINHGKGALHDDKYEQNPAQVNAWPGVQVEPGFKHTIEFKTVVIWGKLFSAGLEKPGCCGLWLGNGTQIRGYPGDDRKSQGIDRDKKPNGDDMTFADNLHAAMPDTGGIMPLDDWNKMVNIIEHVGAHSDYLRIDLFYNPESHVVRINEVEGFFRCEHTIKQQNPFAVDLMARVWARGWKAYLKEKEDAKLKGREPKLQSVLRPFSRSQMAVQTAKGDGEMIREKVPKDFMNILIFLALTSCGFCCLCSCLGVKVLQLSRPSRTVAYTSRAEAQQSLDSVELSQSPT